MSSIVCGNRGCKWNGGPFCKQEFVFLDQLGRCKVWFGNDGLLRREPLYPADTVPESVESKKQPFPQNLDTSEEKENETVNAVSAKKDEGEKEN